jgi:hypothetical protein
MHRLPPRTAGDGTDHFIIAGKECLYGRDIIQKRGHCRTVVYVFVKNMPIDVGTGQNS